MLQKQDTWDVVLVVEVEGNPHRSPESNPYARMLTTPLKHEP